MMNIVNFMIMAMVMVLLMMKIIIIMKKCSKSRRCVRGVGGGQIGLPPPHTYCDEDNLDYNDYDDSLDAPLMRMSMICK